MLQDHTERYRRALITQSPMALEHGAIDHRNIAAACAADDAAAAGAWAARHLSRTALALISISEPTYDSVSIRESLRM
jgi:DNA-binding GntR family transcriptional regulator